MYRLIKKMFIQKMEFNMQKFVIFKSFFEVQKWFWTESITCISGFTWLRRICPVAHVILHMPTVWKRFTRETCHLRIAKWYHTVFGSPSKTLKISKNIWTYCLVIELILLINFFLVLPTPGNLSHELRCFHPASTSV